MPVGALLACFERFRSREEQLRHPVTDLGGVKPAFLYTVALALQNINPRGLSGWWYDAGLLLMTIFNGCD
ncbi:hypothetical protein G8770_05125 [Aestuariicella hydrocarbonica]|uniref:Uncharacterized protein n=1 Tax=Pseudomaricurvus hydrocarbonicus TaxID=1470433 RepID=A0A9E5JT08_9GAMM|nr:hypothetical protein [Aestuariicella hydrocarbonica]NHO64921.1 hypothetical protein [Aestuariicella hydrocarbonica]